MYVAVDNSTSIILGLGELELSEQERDYPVLVLLNGFRCAYPPAISTLYDVGDVDELPDLDFARYTYTPQDGFKVYEDPKSGVEVEIEQIESDYRQRLVQEVSENVYNT